MQGVTAVEWVETVEEQGPEALLETLHCLRVAITIFDADSRLIFASAHLRSGLARGILVKPCGALAKVRP